MRAHASLGLWAQECLCDRDTCTHGGDGGVCVSGFVWGKRGKTHVPLSSLFRMVPGGAISLQSRQGH